MHSLVKVEVVVYDLLEVSHISQHSVVVEEKEVPLGVQFQVPMHNLLAVFVVGDVSGEGTSKGGIQEGGKDQCDSDGGVRKVWSSGSIHKSYDEKEDKVEVSSQYRYA